MAVSKTTALVTGKLTQSAMPHLRTLLPGQPMRPTHSLWNSQFKQILSFLEAELVNYKDPIFTWES